MDKKSELAPLERIAETIRTVRGRRIILDTDLADLYGVPTSKFNQAVKRNRKRFPEDFMFPLTKEEWDSLRSQIVILKPGRGQHRKYIPLAFTEHGALMAANLLNSSRAVAMSVYVIRAFVKMREDQAANAEVFKRLAEIDQRLLTHDVALRDVYQKLLPLLTPPPNPPKRKIGFSALKT